MRPHYLKALFAPQSAAMFGASETPDSVGQVVFKNLLEGGFAGEIYAINPKRDEVQGQKAYPDLDSITVVAATRGSLQVTLVGSASPHIPSDYPARRNLKTKR